jgi:hypothetical protein
MKIKVKDLLIKSSKSSFFKRGTDIFFINKRFIKKTKKGTFFEFPEWATQIYVKHNNEMYKIFLNDFREFYINNIPIPFENHFPQPKQSKPIKKKIEYKVVAVREKPIISDYKSKPLETYRDTAWLEPTHDEIVLARRNGEI